MFFCLPIDSSEEIFKVIKNLKWKKVCKVPSQSVSNNNNNNSEIRQS